MSGITDFHVHTGPSLVPRHHSDTGIADVMNRAGITTFVIKAHEGSTAERAALIGGGAIGGVVLNAPVGGANPDAVRMAARLGARIVWLPTMSAPAHCANAQAKELELHDAMTSSEVMLFNASGAICPAWHDVFDVMAEYDLILASGHLTMGQTITFFRAAREHKVQRFLVNHPLLSFLDWQEEHVGDLLELDSYLEVGPLADLMYGGATFCAATAYLAGVYPTSHLVFGSDLGHAHSPDIEPGVKRWVEECSALIGEDVVDAITRENGSALLSG